MDVVNLLISVVSGAVGGNLAGSAWKDKSLGTIGNTIAGLIGGAAGGYILQAVGFLNTVGGADLTLGTIAGTIGASGVGGAALTAIAGMVKNMMGKSS